jgi:pentatricopeptide repeat protein
MALYIMIATYFRCQRHISKIYQIYFQFRKLVAEGHESISPLAETDHTYNEFLIALRRHRGALRSCVRLVDDMLNPPPPSPTGRAIVHARPSMHTWTILLTAFTFNRQTQAAEKVRDMMAKYGVKANDVTWNTIINGYANAQQIPETTHAIKEMERHGFAIDQYTIKSLRWVRDPDSLWDAMDAMDETATSAQSSESTEVDEGPDDDLLINNGLKRLEAKEKLTPKI